MSYLHPRWVTRALRPASLLFALLSALPLTPAAELRKFDVTSDHVLDVAFLPDGRRFVCSTGVRGTTTKVSTDHAVYLWDLESGKPIHRLAGHASTVRCVGVAPDGQMAASGGQDKTVRCWDLKSGREIEARRHLRGAVFDLAFAPDGRHILKGGPDPAEPIDYWDPAAPADSRQFGKGTSPVNALAITADGRRAMAAHNDNLLRLWDLATGQEVRRFEGHEKGVYSVALTADGRRALSGSWDGTIRLWDVEAGGQLLQFKMRTRAINQVVIARDGQRAYSCCNDPFLWVWDVATGTSLGKYEGHEGQIYSIALAPDGLRALTASADGTVRLWDLGATPGARDAPRAVAELPSPSDSAPWTIAVLDFADLGPAVELGVLRKALAEMLIGDLSKHAELRVVERGRVEHVLSETQAGKSGLVDPATALRTGAELAADYLLTGSLAGSEGKVTIKAALTRTGATKPRGEWSVSGSTEKLFDLERDLAGQIRSAIGLSDAAGTKTPTLAVLGFKDLSPKPRLKEMESGFSEILQTELANLEGIHLVEREKLDAVLKEQKLTLSGLAAADAAVKVGKLLGANRLVFGSFLEVGTNLRVEARLVDTATAAVLKAETAQGPTEQFAAMFEDLALRLARDLTARPQPRAAARKPAGAAAHKLEAARHYALGREALRLDHYTEAAAAFERALLLEPDNLDTHYYRIDALFKANDHRRVIEAATQALSRTFTPKQ